MIAMKRKAGKVFIGDQEIAQVGSWEMSTNNYSGTWRGERERFEIVIKDGWWAYIGRYSRHPDEAFIINNWKKVLTKMFRPKFWVYKIIFKMTVEEMMRSNQ